MTWASNGMDHPPAATPATWSNPCFWTRQLNDNNLTLKAKYDRMRAEEVMFEAVQHRLRLPVLIVSYGTMSRVCRTAIDMLKDEGIEVGMIRPQTLFPFPEAGRGGCGGASRARTCSASR
jgi:2-oxoglutarate ferredoxin oxidoreductase subunit alpha